MPLCTKMGNGKEQQKCSTSVERWNTGIMDGGMIFGRSTSRECQSSASTVPTTVYFADMKLIMSMTGGSSVGPRFLGPAECDDKEVGCKIPSSEESSFANWMKMPCVAWLIFRLPR